MTKAQIKYMVDRFLSWNLPDNFAPDAGITYVRPNYPESWPGPSGTNLLDAGQAEAMVRHMIDGLPNADGTPNMTNAQMQHHEFMGGDATCEDDVA